MSTFGELLSELRKDRSMLQRELADILHVSVGTISNYEKGVHYPDIDTLLEIADYFHVTTDYLLGRCASNLSVDVFGEALLPGVTTGDVIQMFRELPADRKNAVYLALNDMVFRAAVNHYDEDERR